MARYSGRAVVTDLGGPIDVQADLESWSEGDGPDLWRGRISTTVDVIGRWPEGMRLRLEVEGNGVDAMIDRIDLSVPGLTIAHVTGSYPPFG
jgi:hypothetical protein